MSAIISHLHNSFETVTNNEGQYLLKQKGLENQCFSFTKRKRMPASEVFRVATEQIRNGFAGQIVSNLDQVLLKEDGERLYAKYQAKTSGLGRTILKLIQAVATFFLPIFFANTLANAEKATKEAHDEYQAAVNWLKNPVREKVIAVTEKGKNAIQQVAQYVDQTLPGQALRSTAAAVQFAKKGQLKLAAHALVSPVLYAANTVTDKLFRKHHPEAQEARELEEAIEEHMSPQGNVV